MIDSSKWPNLFQEELIKIIAENTPASDFEWEHQTERRIEKTIKDIADWLYSQYKASKL